MPIRKDLVVAQFRNSTPNTVLAWNPSGVPFNMGVFTPATSVANGTIGLVPAPLAGQETFILSNNGWIANSGGGIVGGSGANGRLAFWSASNTISSKNTLLWDDTNEILKAPTINLARAALPPNGIANCSLLYITPFFDFYGRSDGQWIPLTRQNEVILEPLVTDYTIQEVERNCYIETTSASPVTIRLPNLSYKYSATIVKGGAGNITFAVTGGPALVATAATITTLRGAAVVYHSDIGTNTWKAYGNLG